MMAVHDDAPRSQPNWRRRFTIAVVVAVALVLLWFAAAAVIPRWWAQRVGNVVDGSLTVGALYGLFIGFVFTVAPLLLLVAVIRWRTDDRTWLGWLGWILLALLLAAPNLMTLGIVLGISDAAHAGDRTLDVEAPGFRLWSLIGAILGGLAVVGTIYLVRSRRTSRRRAAALRDELRSREQT
jgi:ABC-type multidrug transport system fused ATPase/permease subunit